MSEEPPSTTVEIAILLHDPAWRPQLDRAGDIAYRAALAALSHRPRWEERAPGSQLHGIEADVDAGAELTVVLADDKLVQGLNREYRGRDEPTNVLSFGGLEPTAEAGPGAPRLLGDVVLARETILREAAEQGKSVSDHVSHLVVHGVLHLLGHDHEAPEQAAEMEDLERTILAALGVHDPYDELAPAGDSVS